MKKRKLKHIDYVYPSSPQEHIVPVAKGTKPVGGADYPFVDTRFWFRVTEGLVYALAWIIFPIWAFLWMRTRVFGRKNFRALKGKGMMIAANHIHILDAPVLGACATRTRKLRIVTLKENMYIPAAWIIRRLGCMPLGEGFGGMRKFTKTVDGLLNSGKPVLFYPEAALWPYYTGLRPFMPGAFSFAVRNKIPVLPAAYTFKVNRRGIKNRLVLNILPAIMPEEGENAQQLADRVYQAMLDKMREFYSDKRNNKSGRKIDLGFYQTIQDAEKASE